MVEVKGSLRSVGRAVLAAAVVCVVPIQALAVECRTIGTVKESASVDTNTSKGGHLTQHIAGETPPPRLSQADKTLFTSPEAYLGVWRNYESSNKIPNLNCSGPNPYHEIAVRDILPGVDRIGGFKCYGANPDGTCSNQQRTKCDKIAFGYRLEGSNWILVTSYPTGVCTNTN
ncbi:MAG TPA: hypothetical protein VNA24_16520 [Hyalangium sp.]|jgi:hypothetical protein|nr:hypothetical protein [Hyalangium sp.]